MPTLTLAVAALLLGLAAPPSDPAPSYPLDSAGTSRDFDKPPPGSPADQALWKACHEIDNDLVIAQTTSSRLQIGARGARLVDRLRDPAQRGGLSADAAEALAARLEQKWAANAEVMASQWPVSRVRVCRYELMTFESAMIADASPSKERQLAAARADVQECVAKATAVLEPLRRTSEELEAAIADADRALRAAPARTPAAAPANASSRN